MITISLCMIVKNEEDTLSRCLNCTKDVVDEIIIVDTGSTDRTKEIAKSFTEKVYDFEWIDDFSAARNFSYEHATMDYILWLDADDVILPEDINKFKKLKEILEYSIDVVMMKYNTGFDKQGKVVFSCYRERLSRNDKNFRWKEPVHEYLDAGWKRITADICVTHAKPHERKSGGRNIGIYEKILNDGKELSPRGMYYYARELKEHKRFADAIKWFRLFLESKRGWVEDNITACSEIAKCCIEEKMHEQALDFMLESFKYDIPRPEICCQIGYYFKNQSQYKPAAFWFETALNLDNKKTTWGFRNEDYLGYIPCIELAVCYDRLREYVKAASFNERAAKYKPECEHVLLNRKYFENKLKNSNILKEE